MEIKYSDKAVKQLKKIHKGDKKSAIFIVEGIESYASFPQKSHDVKILKGKFGDFKRLRIGNFRVIFDEEFSVMNIYEIKHRQGAYND